MSPAQVIFGRNLRDHLLSVHGQFQPQPQRAPVLAGWLINYLNLNLNLSDTVLIQDQKANNSKAGRWNKSSVVMKVLPFSSYLIKVHSSRHVTKRNQRFLRKFTPFTPAILN